MVVPAHAEAVPAQPPNGAPALRPTRGVGSTLRSIRASGSRIRRPHVPRIRPSSIRARVHTFDSFRYRNYRLMWGATAFSSGAFWLQQVIIGWLAYELTESAFLTTLAMGLDALPILIVGPVGGLLADSWDRRKLLAGMLAYQCLATAVFGAAVMLGHLETWHIFAYILAMGFAFVILDPTRMTIIASSVPSASIVNAFALNSLGFSVMRLAAPAVGGGVLALWGAWPALMLEAALHMVAVGFALGLRLPRMEQAPLRFKSGFSRIAEGARYVKGQPVILGIALMGVLMPLLGFTFVNGLMPVYAAEVFFVDSVGLGLLMASIGGRLDAGNAGAGVFQHYKQPRAADGAVGVPDRDHDDAVFSHADHAHGLSAADARQRVDDAVLIHGERDDPEHRAGGVQGQGGVAIRANVRVAAGGQPDGGSAGAGAGRAHGDAAGGGVHAGGAAGAVADVPVAVAAAVGGLPRNRLALTVCL